MPARDHLLLTTGWIPISAAGVVGGHDVGAAASIAIAALGNMGPLEGCLALFPLGSHANGTTVNDQQTACLSATQGGGQTFAAFLNGFVRTLTPSQVTAMLVAAGVLTSATTAAISPDLDFGKVLPANCLWAGAMTISCTSQGVTTEVRPISAPPVLDPPYENNFINKATHRTESPGESGPNQVPLPVPWIGVSGREIWREALRTCVAQLGAIANASQTVGEVLGVDDCQGEDVFFTGKNVSEATQHDADVIALNPDLMLLTYVSAGEKNAAGIFRLQPPSNPLCVGGEPDEQCDEYPYFATIEGYSGAPPLPQPDYRYIDGYENGAQGGFFGGFTKNCPSLKNPASPDRSFLVVATQILPATFGYCGR